MAQSKSLSWNDRLAIIEHFKPSDEKVVEVMGVTQDELDTARDLKGSGVMVPTPDLDLDSYSTMFGGKATSTVKPTTASKATAVTSTKKTPTAKGAAQTATKPVKIPKKRGRKGDKISVAFGAIPTTAVPAEKFATDNNVSLAVLRQSKRFDTAPQLGNVRVKKDKVSKTLMIWRDEPDKD